MSQVASLAALRVHKNADKEAICCIIKFDIPKVIKTKSSEVSLLKLQDKAAKRHQSPNE